MTIENWLMIAVIISTLIAPTLPNLVQSRSNQPKPAPEPNQPKKRIQRIGGWLRRFLQSLWWIVGWPLVVITCNIYILLRELRKTAPVNRGKVFLISVSVAAILFLLLNMTVNLMQLSIFRQTLDMRTQNETISTLAGTVRTQLDMIKTLGNTVDVMGKTLALPDPAQSKTDKPTPGTLHKMLIAIKNLFTKPN